MARASKEDMTHQEAGSALKVWMEQQYRARRPGFRQRINAMVRDMLREQDALADRELFGHLAIL